MYSSRNRPSTMWLLLPILIVVGVASVLIAIGVYFDSTGATPTEFYWFPFPFFPLIFIPIIFLFFFGFRWFFWGCWGQGRYYGQYDPAMVALRERYAKGEISKEKLDQMTEDLERQ